MEFADFKNYNSDSLQQIQEDRNLLEPKYFRASIIIKVIYYKKNINTVSIMLRCNVSK